MTTYTSGQSLPIQEASDTIRGDALDNIRTHLNDLSRATSTELDVADAKNSEQDERLDVIQPRIAVPAVRQESGEWVWDPQNPTHFIVQDHTGAMIVRPAPWPTPATTPEFNW